MKSEGILQSCYLSIVSSNKTIEEIASLLVIPSKDVQEYIGDSVDYSVEQRIVYFDDGSPVDLPYSSSLEL